MLRCNKSNQIKQHEMQYKHNVIKSFNSKSNSRVNSSKDCKQTWQVPEECQEQYQEQYRTEEHQRQLQTLHDYFTARYTSTRI